MANYIVVEQIMNKIKSGIDSTGRVSFWHDDADAVDEAIRRLKNGRYTGLQDSNWPSRVRGKNHLYYLTGRRVC